MSRAQAGASGRLARGVRALCAFAAIVAALPAGCGGSKVDPFVAELRKLNRVESGSVGYGGSPSDVYAVYEKLSAVASRRELIRLLDDRSPAVRVYAFFALQEKFPETDLFALLKTRLADEEEVETLFGCSGGKRRVADLMLDSIEEGLTEGEREELAAWLLNHPTRLAARGRVLYQPLGPGHHAAVRRLAEAGVPEALPALARFGDEADAALIARHISADSYESLEAVEIFPRAEFFAPLAAMHQRFLDQEGWSTEMRQYYRAVAAFGTPAAGELLASALDIPASNEIREYHVRFAFQAAIDYRGAYTEILFRFLDASPLPDLPYSGPAEGPYTEDRVLGDLWKADPERTIRAVRAQFTREDFYLNSEFALVAMTRLLLRELTPDDAAAVINEGVKRATVHQLPALARSAAEHKPESSIPILFQRLTTDNNPHVQISAATALLAYGRKGIRERIQRLLDEGAIPKGGSPDPEWGHEAIRKMLQDAPRE